MKSWFVVWVCACGLLGSMASQAQTRVEVGRVKVVLVESGWKDTEVVTEDVGVDKGVSGMIRGKSRLLTLADESGEPLAALLIYATWGSNLSLRIESRCPANEQLYVRDFTKGRNAAPECMKIGGPFDGQMMASTVLPRLRDASRSMDIAAPAEAYVVMGDFGSGNGAIIDIEGVVSTRLLGLDAAPQSPVQGALAPGIAAWADALGEAARSALRSMSGELRMPALRFEPADATPK